MTDRLPPPERIARVRAAPISKAGDGWLVAYTTGNSAEDGEDWCVQTDNVRGSALLDLELPGDAKDDAESIAAILNAYRTGRLVLAPMPLFPDAGGGT